MSNPESFTIPCVGYEIAADWYEGAADNEEFAQQAISYSRKTYGKKVPVSKPEDITSPSPSTEKMELAKLLHQPTNQPAEDFVR